METSQNGQSRCHISGTMKQFIAFVTLIASLFPAAAGASEQAINCRVIPEFSSRDNIAQAVLQAIRSTEKRITLALYGFNNRQFADELVKLARRDAAVQLKVDSAKSSEKKTGQLIQMLQSAGVRVQTVAPDGRNHNKFAVIDGSRVLTGSYNWTQKAESNWENLLIIDCPELAQRYEAEWDRIR